MTHLDEVAALIERSRANLADAVANHREGRYRTAVALSYYGIFYAAKAVLAYRREGDKTHRGVISAFNRVAVAHSDFPIDVSRLLKVAQTQRLSADYDMSRAVGDWQKQESSLAIERATTFLDEVEAWLMRNSLPDEDLF
ncbi:MAG: HEPN domain-containing protein [Acidimicrobiia bacterium]|nr:HEPN domain-containing protein [Acidimicrobiia bacterium]